MEGWMDENFIKNIFQTVLAESVQVKVIRDRNSGYVLFFLCCTCSLFSCHLRCQRQPMLAFAVGHLNLASSLLYSLEVLTLVGRSLRSPGYLRSPGTLSRGPPRLRGSLSRGSLFTF